MALVNYVGVEILSAEELALLAILELAITKVKLLVLVCALLLGF